MTEVPLGFTAKGGEYLSMPIGTEGYEETYSGIDHYGDDIIIKATRILQAGEKIDLTSSIQTNDDFFEIGPGYSAE